MRRCTSCDLPISTARLDAVPSATQCTYCLHSEGDVQRTSGFMTWEHKTAPTIVIGKDADTLRSYDRKR